MNWKKGMLDGLNLLLFMLGWLIAQYACRRWRVTSDTAFFFGALYVVLPGNIINGLIAGLRENVLEEDVDGDK